MVLQKYKQNIKLFFLVLVIIVNSGYMLQVADRNFNRVISAIILVIGGFIGIKFVANKIIINRMEYRIVLFFIISNIFTMMGNFEISIIYFKYIALVLIAFYFVQQQSIEKTSAIVVNIMVLLSVISLLFMLIIMFYGKITSFSMVTTENSKVQYYNYLIFFCPNLLKNITFRNQGIFWEPGLYASYLLIAMMLEINFSEKTKIWKILILAITLFTTLSTAGILMLPLVILLSIERFVRKKYVSYLFLLIIITIVMTLYVFKDNIIQYLVMLNPRLFFKLLGNGTTKITRLYAPLLNLNIFLNNPIFGAGYLGATKIFQMEKAKYYIDSQTSTNFFMLASLGIFGILYTIWWVKSIFANKSFSVVSKILIFLLIFIILNKEPHNELLLTWVILFLLIKNRRKRFLRSKNKKIVMMR